VTTPDFAPAHFGLGDVAPAEGRTADAVAAYERGRDRERPELTLLGTS